MRALLFTSTLAATLSIGAGMASATPRLASSFTEATPHVTLVSGGCGIGNFRGPMGYCLPKAAAAYVGVPYAAGYVVATRACPFGYHLGPYGRACWAN